MVGFDWVYRIRDRCWCERVLSSERVGAGLRMLCDGHGLILVRKLSHGRHEAFQIHLGAFLHTPTPTAHA
jgi:hypothetical protein